MKRTLIIPETLEAGASGLEDARRTDEFLEGAKWVLEREAEKGREVWQDPSIYVLAMEGVVGHPRLSLFYTIAYDKVLLLSLSAGNGPSGPAETGRAGSAGIGPGTAGY
jgi:hypothetical protein